MGSSIFGTFYLMIIIFDINCLKDTYYQEILWIDLFKHIDLFDSVTRTHIPLFVESIHKYYSKFAVSNFLCVTCYLLILYGFLKIMHYRQMIAVAYCYFLYIQIFVTYILFGKLLRIVEKRYDFFRNQVKEEYSPSNTFEGRHLRSSHIFWILLLKILTKFSVEEYF